MQSAPLSYPQVTLLITHYNRSASLERLLSAFRSLSMHFGEVIVSDDCSKSPHAEKLWSLQAAYGFRLLVSPVNGGLGHNLNKGQDAVKTPYTLYIQEDFIPLPEFARVFPLALDMLERSPEIDMARFYAYFRYPYLSPAGNGFSEMRFRWLSPGYKKFYMYSDHPHLRRSGFLEKFGRYREDLKGDITEYHMMISFLRKKGRALFFEEYQSLLEQKNDSVEPSTMKRDFWRESNNILVFLLRHFYRHFKMNWDYLTWKR